MKPLYILIIFLFLQNPVKSQDTLDVLPLSGRNELFHTYLMEKGAELWEARRDSVDASLLSMQALMDRQNQLRVDYFSLLGDLPDPTPLNAEVLETIQGDGYIIEKLYYQSSPNHHVTANFYIPDTGSGPFPTVLVMCGHYPVGKTIGLYQQLCALLAINGIAALIVDPFSQGERYQIQDPDNGNLVFQGGSGTSAHTRLDVGAMLTGSSVVAKALWDNHRGIDYLYARTDVVDTTKVGCTGSSGGGAQATYLLAFDERIKVAAVNSFLMNEETLYSTIGPQTGSQNLSFEGAHLIEHPDYITMFAPKPLVILSATQDFFDVDATFETYNEAAEVYTTLGVPDHIRYFEEDAGHGYFKPRREEAVRWFRKWFYNDDAPITEPGDLVLLPGAELEVTTTGEVTTEFPGEKTVTDLNIEMANGYATHRADFWNQNTQDSCLNKVRELIRWESYDPILIEETETTNRNGYTVTKMEINSGDHVPVTGLLFVPDNITTPAPSVIYVDGRGKKEDAAGGGVLEQVFVDSGKIVLTIDVRGFGETADNTIKNESKHGNKEHRNAVIAGYIGKTLIGQRVEDIMKAIDVIEARSDIDLNDLTLVGIDRAGSAVLHAAALDNRVNKTIIRSSFDSWLPMVANPTELHNLTHVVPFALKYYDLADLINTLPSNAVMYFDEPYDISTSTTNLAVASNGDLGQNFPNPASVNTVIPYQLKRSGEVTVKIIDQLGKLQIEIIEGFKNRGRHELLIDLRGFSKGQYFYQLLVNNLSVGTKKMITVD